MIPVLSGVQVWLTTGYTDMRKGFDGLALLVQETLRRNPHNGHLFVFRGRRGSLIKVLWHDGQAPDHRDALGPVQKMAFPMVAAGKVYVPTPGSVVVYGLLPGAGRHSRLEAAPSPPGTTVAGAPGSPSPSQDRE